MFLPTLAKMISFKHEVNDIDSVPQNVNKLIKILLNSKLISVNIGQKAIIKIMVLLNKQKKWVTNSLPFIFLIF